MVFGLSKQKDGVALKDGEDCRWRRFEEKVRSSVWGLLNLRG